MAKFKHQPKIGKIMKMTDNAAADCTISEWAIAHDIPPNAMSGPLWKRANKAIAKTGPNYIPMNPQKLIKVMLPKLKAMAEKESDIRLQHQPDAGRTVTGDGATKGGSHLSTS